MSKTIWNPPFDKRIYNVQMLARQNHGKAPGLRRGHLIQKDADALGNKYGCKFLYNPQSVSASHSIDTSIVPVKDPNDVSTSVVPLSQTVNFAVLFDRTYETWDSSKYKSPEGRMGVHADVLALYNMVGITSKGSVATDADYSSVFDKAKKGNMANGVVAPMIYTPMIVRLGGPLVYNGVITSLDVVYSHWTQNMVPSRCGVSISINLLPELVASQQDAALAATSHSSANAAEHSLFGSAGSARGGDGSYFWTEPPGGSALLVSGR